MAKTTREWNYLERRPGSSYQQLCIKGKREWAWTLYCDSMNEKEPRTPEQLAADWGMPFAAVQEAIEYCQSDPPDIREDKRRSDILREARGMNNNANKMASSNTIQTPTARAEGRSCRFRY